MKKLLFLTLTGPLLSIATFAQTPSPSILPTPSPSPTNTQASPSPSLNPIASRSGIPDLPYIVEILASGVMLGSVFVVFVLVRRQQELKGLSIGPRHIQFVAVCLIVPTILILGLEQVLSKETTATLIGGLTGYLLSGLGKYEPPKGDGGGDITPKPDDSGSGAGLSNKKQHVSQGRIDDTLYIDRERT